MLYDGETLLREWVEITDNVIKSKICMCMVKRGCNVVYRDGSKGDPPIDWKTGKCTGCFKYDISRAYTCTGCQRHYVKNFKHPFWCYYHNPKCWDCVDAETEPSCGVLKDCDGIRSWHKRVAPPEVAIRNRVINWTDEEREILGL